MSAPVAAIITLGCKLNLADSAEIARALRARGFQVADGLCEADAYVVNTCSVTHVADQKSRRLIRAARRMSPGASIAVTGCYPQTAGRERVEALGADIVAGTRDDDKATVVGFVAERCGTRGRDPAPANSDATARTRAFIKAQEGCNDVCAFCIVPRTRHREESRSIDRVVAEVRRAVDDGAKEVVITGTQLGAWGRDLEDKTRPGKLIAAILERTEVARLRFSSLQPQDITPELLATWQDPRVMPHFHLALQSGSERVLKAMRRRYTAREYRMAVERIAAAVPGVAITTDVIAGFPGESADDFEDTLALCREAGFARIHAFPYSTRTGTTAAKLPGHVSPGEKKERTARLRDLGMELAAAFHRRHLGEMRPVLWEQERKTAEGTFWSGYTDNYIPVYAPPNEMLANRILPVRLEAPMGDGVFARTGASG